MTRTTLSMFVSRSVKHRTAHVNRPVMASDCQPAAHPSQQHGSNGSCKNDRVAQVLQDTRKNFFRGNQWDGNSTDRSAVLLVLNMQIRHLCASQSLTKCKIRGSTIDLRVCYSDLSIDEIIESILQRYTNFKEFPSCQLGPVQPADTQIDAQPL